MKVLKYILLLAFLFILSACGNMEIISGDTNKEEIKEEKSVEDYIKENTDNEFIKSLTKSESKEIEKIEIDGNEDTFIINMYLSKDYDFSDENKEKLESSLNSAYSTYIDAANDLAKEIDREKVNIEVNYLKSDGKKYVSKTYTNKIF